MSSTIGNLKANEAAERFELMELVPGSAYSVRRTRGTRIPLGVNDHKVNSGDPVTIITGAKETFMVSGAAISRGDTLIPSSAAGQEGQVIQGATGNLVGEALEAATAQGEIIRVAKYDRST